MRFHHGKAEFKPQQLIDDRYHVIEPIGEGTYGEVYKVAIYGDGRFWALKILKKEYRDDDEKKKAFYEEADYHRLASNLDHPNKKHANIVAVKGVSPPLARVPYIVMEFIPEGSLLDWMNAQDRKYLLPEAAVTQIIAILEGVKHLHSLESEGMIHRDLKLDNVMFGPRITDFGGARLLASSRENRTVYGSIKSMAPEAFKGEHDILVDIWAVGAMFYRLLCLDYPFGGLTPIETDEQAKEVENAIIKEPPAPLPDSVPVPLQNVVYKSLSKNKADRYQSAAEMQDAVQAAWELVKRQNDLILAENATKSSPKDNHSERKAADEAPITVTVEKEVEKRDDDQVLAASDLAANQAINAAPQNAEEQSVASTGNAPAPPVSTVPVRAKRTNRRKLLLSLGFTCVSMGIGASIAQQNGWISGLSLVPTPTPEPTPTTKPIAGPTPTVGPILAPTVMPILAPTATSAPTATPQPTLKPTAQPTTTPQPPHTADWWNDAGDWQFHIYKTSRSKTGREKALAAAYKNWHTAVRLNPNHIKALTSLCWVAGLDYKNPEKAKRVGQKVLTLTHGKQDAVSVRARKYVHHVLGKIK